MTQLCVPHIRLICDLLPPISLSSYVLYSLYITGEMNCHIEET
jgi:hypothetical protein